MQTIGQGRTDRKPRAKGTRWLKGAVVILLVSLTVWWAWPRWAQGQDIGMAREMLHLAPLPADATDVRAASIHDLTWDSAFVKFTAPPASIETFLADSPGLKRVTPQQFTPAHRYLPYGSVSALSAMNTSQQNAYFHDDAHLDHLPWFDPTIQNSGRGYFLSIGPNPDDTGGEIVVDDEHHIVYIHANEG